MGRWLLDVVRLLGRMINKKELTSMIPVNMKLVVFEMLHSILRTCSLANVIGSSGDSSHFNLINGKAGN